MKEWKERNYGGERGEVILIKREDCGLNDEKQNEEIMFYLCSFLNVFEFLLQIFFKDASDVDDIKLNYVEK